MAYVVLDGGITIPIDDQTYHLMTRCRTANSNPRDINPLAKQPGLDGVYFVEGKVVMIAPGQPQDQLFRDLPECKVDIPADEDIPSIDDILPPRTPKTKTNKKKPGPKKKRGLGLNLK